MHKNAGRIDYEKELNPAQLEAVMSVHGPHLVIAGAGSGKTRVLVYRVAHLVEKGVRPQDILLLTFTRRAAKEMLLRAERLLDERCSRVSGGTFHSFANSVLRKYASLCRISADFTILDQSDAEDTINLVRTQLGFHKQDKRFPRKSTILEVISKSTNKSQKIEEVLFDEYPHFLEWEDQIKRIRREYEKYKRDKSLLDYDDLLVFFKNLLSDNPQARSALSKKYGYIMVDEYQDTNKLQAHIACLLASEHRNIMVVGDDAQSIYSFRGANFKNIIDFPKIFKDTRVITLEENYRSTQPILDLTNEIISRASDKFDKNLYTRNKGGKLPVFIDARDEHAQSKYIADKILELREEGAELKDIAVLFRSGWHSNDLEVELAGRGLPFVKYGGQKFVEASHIKDVISYLRVINNGSDEVSWLRILLLMPGIGPRTAERFINKFILKKGDEKIDDSFVARHEYLGKLFTLLKDIPPGLSPQGLIQSCIEHYKPLLKENYDDFDKRLHDLDSLIRIASRYRSTESFLTDMALEPPERSLVEKGLKDADDSSLVLSTIHSAKGLEWQTVFLIYVAEGHLPSYLSFENKDAMEEERRLFYVAATRAKENLYLLKPHLDRSPRSGLDEGGMVFTQPSRFIEEGSILHNLVRVEASARIGDPFESLDPGDIADFVPEDKRRLFEAIEEFFPDNE